MRLQCNVKFLLDRSDPVLAQTEHLHPQLGRLQHLDWLGQLGQLGQPGQPYQLGQPCFERLERDTPLEINRFDSSHKRLWGERGGDQPVHKRGGKEKSAARRVSRKASSHYMCAYYSLLYLKRRLKRGTPHICVWHWPSTGECSLLQRGMSCKQSHFRSAMPQEASIYLPYQETPLYVFRVDLWRLLCQLLSSLWILSTFPISVVVVIIAQILSTRFLLTDWLVEVNQLHSRHFVFLFALFNFLQGLGSICIVEQAVHTCRVCSQSHLQQAVIQS